MKFNSAGMSLKDSIRMKHNFLTTNFKGKHIQIEIYVSLWESERVKRNEKYKENAVGYTSRETTHVKQ